MVFGSMIMRLLDFKNGTFLKLEWESKALVIEGNIDTFYETYDVSNEDFEYFAMAFFVKRIVKAGVPIAEYSDSEISATPITIDGLMEISMCNEPSKICLSDGTILEF